MSAINKSLGVKTESYGYVFKLLENTKDWKLENQGTNCERFVHKDGWYFYTDCNIVAFRKKNSYFWKDCGMLGLL